MKKRCIFLFFCIILWMVLAVGVPVVSGQGLDEGFQDYFSSRPQTEDSTDSDTYSDTYGESDLSESYREYFESSGANSLYRDLPDDTKSFLQQSGITELDSDMFVNLDFWTFMKVLFSQFTSYIRTPLAVLSITLGMVLLASMTGLLKTTTQGSSNSMFSVVAVLCIAGVIVTPIIDIIQSTIDLIDEVGNFMVGFVPVYAGIVAVSGKPVSAFAYNSALMGVTQVIAYLLTHILIPVIGIYLALSIMGSATAQINMGGITKVIRSAVIWCLGLFLTIFVGMLTIRSFVAGSADTVSLRAGKFVLGSVIPVVGSAVSDSLSVVQGSLGVIRSSVGAFGILVLLITFLPAILELMLMSFALKISQAVSDTLDTPEVSKLLEAAHFVLSLLLAVVVCFALMLIVSASLMLVLGNGS